MNAWPTLTKIKKAMMYASRNLILVSRWILFFCLKALVWVRNKWCSGCLYIRLHMTTRYLNYRIFSIPSFSRSIKDFVSIISFGTLNAIVFVSSVAIFKPKRLKVFLHISLHSGNSSMNYTISNGPKMVVDVEKPKPWRCSPHGPRKPYFYH